MRVTGDGQSEKLLELAEYLVLHEYQKDQDGLKMGRLARKGPRYGVKLISPHAFQGVVGQETS
jgi:hypothetical protein